MSMIPPLTCPNCLHRNTFSSREALEHHLLTGHYSCLPYKCEECHGLERFATSKKLEQHLRKDHGKTEYQIVFAPSDDERFKLEQVGRALGACVKTDIASLTSRQPAKRRSRPTAGIVTIFKNSPSRDSATSSDSNSIVGVNTRKAAVVVKQPAKKRDRKPPSAKKTVGAGGLKQRRVKALVAATKPLCRRTDSIGRSLLPPRECTDCNEIVKGKKLSLLQHVNAKHVKIPLRTCTLCGQMFNSYSSLAIYGHLANKHAMSSNAPADKALHIQTDEEAVAQVKAAMETYFPTAR